MKYAERVEIFRDRISEVIAGTGLNHSRFAASIGVDRSTLSQLLSANNLRLPRADTIAAIAEQYGLSAKQIEEALAFFAVHRAEIEHQIALETKLAEQLNS